MTLRSAIFTALAATLMLGSAAQAASWPALPPACTPERAAQWDTSKSESMQEDCHCPPPSMCPKTAEQWTNPALSPLPTTLARRCCTAPTCPAGSDFAGQPVPSDNQCNRPRCPAGSGLAGQPVPQDGNCSPSAPPPPPQQVGCPAADYHVMPGGHVIMGLDHVSASDLPSNLVTPAIEAAYDKALPVIPGNKKKNIPDRKGDNVIIGSASPYNNGFEGAIVYYGWGKVDAHPEFERAASDFLFACRGNSPDGSESIIRVGDRGEILIPAAHSYGTYVGMVDRQINGQSCKYLTCGFIASGREKTTCIRGDAKVTLADGSIVPASEVRVGDSVKGSGGNQVVAATNRYEQDEALFYSINGSPAMITDFHPIKTTEGWKIINPHMLPLVSGKPGYAKSALKVGDTLITEKGEEKVVSLRNHLVSHPEFTYNIKLKNGEDFFANGIAVKSFDQMKIHYE